MPVFPIPLLSTLLPADWITILYLGFTMALACVFRRRLPHWQVYAVAHVMAISAILALASAVSANASPVLRFLHGWYPIATIPIFYWEIPPFTQIIVQGYLDARVARWDERLFRGQPSLYFSMRYPSASLSAFLHLCYFSYYAIVVALAGLLYFQGRQTAFQEAVFAEVLTFDLCLMAYIFIPVAGPRYHSSKIKGRLADGLFFRLTHAILSRGSSKGTAFPSSHCAIASIVALYALRMSPIGFASIISTLSLGLIIGTVYGRFHYAVDALAGTILGGIVFVIAPHLYQMLT